MSFALYCTLFGILVISPERETAATEFLVTPPSPSFAVQGQDFTLAWTYTLNGGVGSARFTNATGGGNDLIGERIGPGKTNSTQKYAARFRAQATNTRAELTILAVQLSDEATYQVTMVSRNDFKPISNDVKVIVLSPTKNIVSSSNQTITAPAELTLNCSADGKPTPTIFWTRVSDNTNVSMPLNITGEKNEESYRCTAYNGVGNPATKVVKITILFPPKVKIAEKIPVAREQNTSLNCEVEGNPTPTISWSPCEARNVLCDKHYLNISKVQSARANYTCTGRNYLGNDSATIVVFIGGKNVYLRLSVNGECGDKDAVWKKLQEELDEVFARTTSYSEAELIEVRCGSLIFDVVLKFRIEVAEDDTISIIESAIVNGRLGELSVNVSYGIIGIPHVEKTTIAAPSRTAPKSHDNKTGLIIGAVLGSVALVALISFTVWFVRKKKCCSETKEVSDKNADAGQGRIGKGPSGADEVAYASTSMLPHSKIPVEKAGQSRGQALPMYAQVDKTKKTSNKGGAAQRQRQPGELQYAEVEHVPSGKSLPRKSSSEPIKPSNEEIVYADLV